MKDNKKSVGILISTYNWSQALDVVLLSLLMQTQLPDEILIADDGSGNDTLEVINRYKALFKIPLKHIWQEDKGFRKSRVLNKAMKEAETDYIIQIDGDIILHSEFIEDHIRNAGKHIFIQGSRTLLNRELTDEVLDEKKVQFSLFTKGIKNRLNAIRFPLFSSLIRTDPTSSYNIKACNLAFWREDYIRVNGYNNQFSGWGWEDDEFTARLVNSGVKMRRLKLAAICYHLHHKVSSKSSVTVNETLYRQTVTERIAYCEDGYAQV